MSSLSARSCLLYIGNDPLLSKSSAALLRTAGYRVRSTNPLHIGEAMRECHYSAVLLCATLSQQETNAAVDTVKHTQPDVPIISIHVGMLGDGPHPASSLVVDALQGPHAFVGAVQSVAATRPKAS